MSIDPNHLEESTSSAQSAITGAPFSAELQQLISARLSESLFSSHYVAVRSSGTDEDSANHSFAGTHRCTHTTQTDNSALINTHGSTVVSGQ